MVKKNEQEEEVIPEEGEERIVSEGETETEVTEEKVTEETVEKKEKEEEIGECVCTHCNNRVIPIPVKTAFGGTSYRCPKCGKFFKPQPEGEEVETEKPGGAEEEETTPLAPLEVEMTERIKKLLPQYLPRVYGIPRGSKRIQAIIDTITPEQTSNPWNLHAHIKNFAPEADDRHLEAIITKIYSTLENEGFIQAPSGPQYRPRYEPRYGRRREYAPRYPTPGYPSYPARQSYGGYPEEFEEEEYFERPRRPPAKPVKVVVDGQTIETDAEGMMALKKFKLEEAESKRLDKEHELRMKKLEAEILNITKGEKGEKEEKVAVKVGEQTLNVPVSIAPLYLDREESPKVKQLEEKLEKLTDEKHEKEVSELRGDIKTLAAKLENQPTLLEQVEEADRYAEARGYTRTGKTTLDVISDLGSKADENAKLLLKRMAPGGEEFKPEVKRTPEERRRKAGEIEKKLEKKEEVLLAEDELIRAAAKMS